MKRMIIPATIILGLVPIGVAGWQVEHPRAGVVIFNGPEER